MFIGSQFLCSLKLFVQILAPRVESEHKNKYKDNNTLLISSLSTV